MQVCNTPACVTVAAEIIESADMSADPCTDFYQVDFRGIELGLGSNWDLILIAVRVRRVAEEQPNPKWKVQLEHFQETLAGSRNIFKNYPTLPKNPQDNQNTLRMVLERPPKKEEEGCTACAKARTYYNACLDK